MSSSGAAKIFKDFASYTTAHGVPHIGSAQNKFLQLFWTVVFFGSTSMFAWQMSELVKKFTKYDVTVGTELVFEDRAFPSVTLCNLNPYRLSAVNLSAQLMNIIDVGNSVTLTKKKADLIFVGQYMTESQRNDISYKLTSTDYKSNILLSCSFNTKQCESIIGGDFTMKYYPQFGNCFEFNYKGVHKSSRAGPLYGLKILALSNQEEYLPTSKSAGIRVAVHAQNEEAFPDAFGYDAAAGFMTSFGVKYLETKRLPLPYGNCSDAEIDYENYYYGHQYSTEGCYRTCTQQAFLDKCKCGDPRFALPPANSTLYKNSRYCEMVGSERLCIDKYKTPEEMKKIVASCSCDQPCEESSFSVTVSTALFPSEVYVPIECTITDKNDLKPWHEQLLAEDPRFVDEPTKVQEKCVQWYGMNTMQFEVYYERMNYQLLSESPAYPYIRLISDMGGQLGLWMGISVITVIEFVLFLAMLAVYCVKHAGDDDYSDFEDSEEEEGQGGNPFNSMAPKEG